MVHYKLNVGDYLIYPTCTAEVLSITLDYFSEFKWYSSEINIKAFFHTGEFSIRTIKLDVLETQLLENKVQIQSKDSIKH